MNPMKHWQKIIFDYRQEIGKHGSTWQGQHATWYNGWINKNDYACRIYPLYQPYVKGQVLEIGAGTGLFTGYLVKDAKHVTAIDPSADMLHYLRGNVSVHTKLTTVQQKAEDFQLPDEGYDFVFASHALFNVMEIDQVLQKLLQSCPIMGLLIGSGEGLALHTAIQREFNILDSPGRPPSYKDLIPILDSLNIRYTWQIIETETHTSYVSKNELLEKLGKACKLEAKHKKTLDKFIKPHIHKNDGGWSYSGVRRHVCFLLKGSLKNHQGDQHTDKLFGAW